MRTEIIKLSVREADKAFPITTEDGEVNSDTVDQELILAVCKEVKNNIGGPDIDKIDIIKYYECMDQKMEKDIHGDDFIKCADYTVTFVDKTTEQWTFVCLM